MLWGSNHADTLWAWWRHHQWSAYRVSAWAEAGRRCPCSCRHRCHRSHLRASPAVSPPRQPFRSRTSRYPPPPAAQSSSASPSAPHRPACRVSAAYPGAPARGSASRRDGSCGRPRRFALLFLCPASAGKRATAPVQPLSPMPNSVAVPSDTPANGWPSFALGKGAERTQSRVHCQNAGQCTALGHWSSRVSVFAMNAMHPGTIGPAFLGRWREWAAGTGASGPGIGPAE